MSEPNCWEDWLNSKLPTHRLMYEDAVSDLTWRPTGVCYFVRGIEDAQRGIRELEEAGEEMQAWSRENLKGHWAWLFIANYCVFELEEDCAMWKLRWG